MKKQLLLAIALFFPFAFGFDCNMLQQKEDCIYLMDSNLSQKELLAVNLMHTHNYKPDHTLVHDWNLGLDITEPPENVNVSQGVFIKDAWMKVLSIMPSVMEDDNLYVPFQAYIMSGNGYDVVLPQNYASSRYPSSDGGDCKRLYSISSNNAEFSISDSSSTLGYTNYFMTTLSQDTILTATYRISVTASIHHYEWDRYCCARDGARCIRYCYSCEYEWTETQPDEVIITDQLRVFAHHEPDLPSFDVLDCYKDTCKAKLDAQENIKLTTQGSEYAHSVYYYSLAYNHKPYYVLQFMATRINETASRNILFDKDDLILKRSESCRIEANGHFSSDNISCNFDHEQLNLSIKTSHLKYAVNDTIEVEIFPKGIIINLSYANETKQAVNSTQFIAKPLQNTIKASYGSEEALAIVHIQDQSKWLLLKDASLFSAISYILYGVLKKVWGAALV